MPQYVRDAGVWKPVTNPSVRDAGVWKPVKRGLVRDAGAWKQFHNAASFELVASLSQVATLTTFTFNSVAIGAPASDRHFILFASGQSGHASGTNTIDAVTVGGVGTTERVSNAVTQHGISGRITSSFVPTGTSGQVVLTFNRPMAAAGLSLYRVTGLASTTPHDTDNNQTGTEDAPLSLACPAGGIVFAGANSRRATGNYRRISSAVLPDFSVGAATYAGTPTVTASQTTWPGDFTRQDDMDVSTGTFSFSVGQAAALSFAFD